MITKLIIANQKALRAKYVDLSGIESALKGWIIADHLKGIESIYVPIDDSLFMRSINLTPVTDAGDCKEVKRAFDEVHRYFRPDCAVILGSKDVIPHQRLFNPVQDNDATVDSDLPYQCDAPYSERIEYFRTPGRAVTRLPDLTGQTDPSGLIRLLEHASGLTARPRTLYEKYFAVTSRTFDGSTRSTLQSVFNSSGGVKDVPPETPNWDKSLLGLRLHFMNCHGYPKNAIWWGIESDEEPVPALYAKSLVGNVNSGTVVATESCFGAELYDYRLARGMIPICNTYLENGAIAYCGSSNISYGSESGVEGADVFCQYFLHEMLAGATVGTAGLNARLRYTQRTFNVIDLKTLAQFLVFGDASATPVLPSLTTDEECPKSSGSLHGENNVIEIFDIFETPPEFREQLKELAFQQGFTDSLMFRSFHVRRQVGIERGRTDDSDLFTEIHTSTSRKIVGKQRYLIKEVEIAAAGNRIVWAKQFISH
jgi:hypothetical protein